ncbi:trimeric intracellular cation channel family protein [Sediminicola luteus]|uniref:Glycine transporter domain-containing protein n=1 Tax=Sediminicola luteus TaxID=319238 RepID=A0A2A4GBB3_9FLAO|nr:trimeric intracellular cation channel family protein [Sediminicola luteus]PCE65042.1 hypothetical protein B7P33_07785 [Sediminicola luteus]
MDFYFVLDILGTISFAISGVLVALRMRLDPFGVFIIAFVTAVGGGTLRDMLIGNTPVGWLTDSVYIFTIMASVTFAILFREKLRYLAKSLFLFDTIGIGLYTLVGIEKGLTAGLIPIMCIALGTMTACFGGVIRDILCNEIPVIFRKEIYATACIAGGSLYFLARLTPLAEPYCYILGILAVIGIRLWAVRFKVSLPSLYNEKA